MNWTDESIFVTGASGFIGGRLCERLVQRGARRVTALVRNPSHGVRIARLPIKICKGDLLDGNSLPRLLADARIVIHLGLGFAGAIVNGTRNILEASLQAGLHRFVHMSTAAVYGLKPDPHCTTEDAPLARTGNVYCDYKLRAELLAEKFARKGLPIVILRPSIVYGPYSRWDTGLVEALRRGNGSQIDNGSGLCNTTYVDNLIDSIFLSIERQEAVGESFFITDGERVTWGDFIAAHAAMMVPKPEIANVSSEEIMSHYKSQPGVWRSSWRSTRRLLGSREFRDMAKQIPMLENLIQRLWYYAQSLSEERRERLRKRIEGSKSPRHRNQGRRIQFPNPEVFAIQTGSVFFSIDKARRLLGYEPHVGFSDGMRITESWLRAANYL